LVPFTVRFTERPENTIITVQLSGRWSAPKQLAAGGSSEVVADRLLRRRFVVPDQHTPANSWRCDLRTRHIRLREEAMHQGHYRGAFADCPTDTLHRAGTHVTHCK